MIMKTKIILSSVIYLACMLCACENNETVTLKENSIPICCEWILDKSYNEARDYLIKNGYTLYQGDSLLYDVKYFNKGDINPTGINVQAQEIITVFISNDTVRSSYGQHGFLNMNDGLKEYRNWSNHSWKNTIPDFSSWDAKIDTIGYWDSPRSEKHVADRNAFIKALQNVDDIHSSVSEHYYRISNPKYLFMNLNKIDGYWKIFYQTSNSRYYSFCATNPF